jgi:hypothetical protein
MKKKLIPFLVGSLMISMLLGSCFYGIRGSRNVVKSERQVAIFESISASAGIDVILTQDSVVKVVVEADDNLQENIKTEVSNGELKIYPEKQIRSCKAKRVYVSFKTVHAIDGSSGADIKSTSRLKLPILEISASSGANIDLALEGDGLTAESSSGGVINLTGTVNNLSVDGSSGSRIKAPDLQSKICNAGASSGATIKISVSEKIIAKASSGGNISVNGNPKEREIEKSSGGSVSFK